MEANPREHKEHAFRSKWENFLFKWSCYVLEWENWITERRELIPYLCSLGIPSIALPTVLRWLCLGSVQDPVWHLGMTHYGTPGSESCSTLRCVWSELPVGWNLNITRYKGQWVKLKPMSYEGPFFLMDWLAWDAVQILRDSPVERNKQVHREAASELASSCIGCTFPASLSGILLGVSWGCTS